jgi:hypothetical protein
MGFEDSQDFVTSGLDGGGFCESIIERRPSEMGSEEDCDDMEWRRI